MINQAPLQNLIARWIAHGAVALLLLPAPGLAQARYLLDTTRTQLSFHASSSMGGFDGTAHESSGYADVSDLQTWRGARGEVRIAVASIRTGIGMRDGHLRTDMKAAQFPWFLVTVDSVRAEPAAASHKAQLFSRLTFRGVTRPRVVAAELRAADDTVAVSGSFPMTFSEFGFTPPSRMLGMAKVKDQWEVRFDVRFVRAP